MTEGFSVELMELLKRALRQDAPLSTSMLDLDNFDMSRRLGGNAIFNRYRLFLQEERFPLSLLLIELHGLGMFYDFYEAEDIENTAQRLIWNLVQISQTGDTLVRIDEMTFLFFLPETDEKKCRKIADHIAGIVDTQHLSTGPCPLDVAIGQATINEEDENGIYDALNRVAEEFYQQKFLIENTTRHSILTALVTPFYKDWPEIQFHSLRLQSQALEFARFLELSRHDQTLLQILTLIHDIGMTGLPDSVSKGTGPLSPSDWEEVYLHPQEGQAMVLEIPELAFAHEYILTHHEKWDGSGYPDKRSGNEIPLVTRIFSLLDVYDVITHDRSYRKRMKPDKAKKEILQGRGSHFDPELTDRFIEFLEK